MNEAPVRTTLLALIVMLGATASAAAQSNSVAAPAQDAQRLAQAPRQVVISDGVFTTEMQAAAAPYATGGPLVFVPARALKPGAEPTVAEFRVRAWREGEGVRVRVFAVTRSGQTSGAREREEQIASVFVPVDKPIEIAATEKYRARRITLTARRRVPPPFPGPYLVPAYHGIDIPVRPWTPPAHPQRLR